jgi:hypothetical protein
MFYELAKTRHAYEGLYESHKISKSGRKEEINKDKAERQTGRNIGRIRKEVM